MLSLIIPLLASNTTHDLLTISQVNEHNGSQSLWHSHHTFVRLTITLTRPLAFPQYVWICLTDECVSDHNERIRSIQIDNLGNKVLVDWIDLNLSLWSEMHSSVKQIQTFSIMRMQNKILLQKLFLNMLCRPEMASTVKAPLLTKRATELLISSLKIQHQQFWHQLGVNWSVTLWANQAVFKKLSDQKTPRIDSCGRNNFPRVMAGDGAQYLPGGEAERVTM